METRVGRRRIRIRLSNRISNSPSSRLPKRLRKDNILKGRIQISIPKARIRTHILLPVSILSSPHTRTIRRNRETIRRNRGITPRRLQFRRR
jgi:hypothetical protein